MAGFNGGVILGPAIGGGGGLLLLLLLAWWCLLGRGRGRKRALLDESSLKALELVEGGSGRVLSGRAITVRAWTRTLAREWTPV